MPRMPDRARWRAALLIGLVTTLVAGCVATPSPSPSAASATPSETRTSSPTEEPEPTPSPTPEPPLSLPLPDDQDGREISFTVDTAVPAEGEGQIRITVTSLAGTLVEELVLRWPTALDEHLFLSPIDPRPLTPRDLLVVEWTKWVEGPGELGEPAGTTSLGWGPLEAGATLGRITIFVTRRAPGPVAFDLQFLAGEAILETEGGDPAEVRVSVD